ncbi:MAG: bifunctional pyr operon transcriptional regulator/uracil phosphoribosyltransferase PyrR, partial [Erysipelotrichaceae bacterium]|nr:bifunctional pyr operon transcriptional regulator/uracil phosphoribosyltransferase PyrR [Erysipelotrichaceae bacterium]
GVDVPCISIDFSYWRDDVMDGVHNIEEIAIDFTDKIVILTDDVLYRGRTVRAAMDGIMHYGRAKMIELAVLVDRGHRELPIKADFVGKNIPTSEKEVIKVKFREFDNEDDKVLII